ncbi:MAG: WD40 repeat domain-containing protein, partial [bacterium]|nr:WD40 repeat domain-containing protein [bacterium]
ATGTNAGGCFLLDSQTGAPLGQLPKQESPVVWSCWSPDARFLATHTVGGKLNVWDAQTRASLRELREAAAGQLGHNGLDWSVLGAIAAGRSRGGVLEVWDATQGSRRFEVSSATGRLISAAWSPDGRRLAAGTLQGELFQVTADGQREASRPKAHVSFLYCLAWSPDGRLIASGARDNAIRIWQADGLTKVEEFSLPDMGWSKDGPYILRMAWARNGAFLATNSKDDVVRLWDVRHLMPRPRSRVVVPSNWVPSLPDSDGHGLGLIRGGDRGADLLPELALSPDGGRMFAGYEDRTLGCWDLRSGSELWTYPQPVGSIVAVSPDGQRLAASGGSNDISIHETTAGRQLQVCRGHTDEIAISCWSPDSRRLASSSDDHTVRIWDADSGQCLHVCSGHEEAIQALSWSEDGASIASGDDDDGAIRIWNAETGHLRATWQAHREVIWGLSWSPDSQALIAAYIDGRTLLLDARDGSVLRVLSDTIDSRCGACQPAWSPDGRYVACAFRNPCRQTRIWDTRTGQELPPPFEFPEEYSLSLAWSPNGAFLASSHEDNVFRFWDVRHLGVRTTVAALFRRSSEPLPTPLRDLLGAFIRLHGLGINAPLSLIADLLALVAGHPVDSPLRQLAPLLRPVAERRWPEAARLGLVAVVLHDVPLPGWPSPPDATADDLRQALTDALHGEPVDPDAAAAPLALLLKSCERLDVRLLDLLELIGPMALAADVGLALRLLPKIGAMPPLADRQRALLGVRSRVQGRPGCATGVAAGADRLIAGGVELGSLSAHRRHLLPTQLALPEWMLRVRHVRGELLFRPREAAEPPRQRPLVILLDVSPPVFGPVEATTRLAAHTAARAVLEAGLTAMLVTPTDTGPPMVALERPSDLAEIWTRRSFNPADEPRLLALAQALRAALPHEPGIPPLVLLLTHTWFGAEADLPALPHLRGLFVQHPGHPTPPVLAGRCERHLCLRPGDLTNLAQQLAEVLA